MIKRIITVIKRDLISNMRDAMILYIILAPLLIALLLNTFIPSANSASFQFAALEEDTKLVRHLSDYGKVEAFSSVEDMKSRIEKSDDIGGIIRENGKYSIIFEGNEAEGIDTAYDNILLSFEYADTEIPVSFRVTEIGWEISQVALIGSISLIMLCMVLGGMLSGLNIVEERQMKTMGAIKVSPLTNAEFIIAKGIPGLVIPLLQSILILIILGLTQINWGMAVVIITASSFISLIIGFLVGILNDDPLTAAASLKVVMLPISVTIVGAILLSDKLQFLLYWSPFYWQYVGISEIITKTASWSGILLYSGIIIGMTGLVYGILHNRLKRSFS